MDPRARLHHFTFAAILIWIFMQLRESRFLTHSPHLSAERSWSPQRYVHPTLCPSRPPCRRSTTFWRRAAALASHSWPPCPSLLFHPDTFIFARFLRSSRITHEFLKCSTICPVSLSSSPSKLLLLCTKVTFNAVSCLSG